MQKLLFLLVLLLAGGAAAAQEGSDKKKEEKTAVSKQAGFVSYESVLTDGKLYLSKISSKNSSGGVNTVYRIQNKSNPGFNAGKPLQITLNKDTFDNYFLRTVPELAPAWPQLVKYAQEKKLSFSEEQGWIDVLNYYNSLK